MNDSLGHLVVPAEPHCRRVAALSVEVGRRCGLSDAQVRMLQDAARNHHDKGLDDRPSLFGRMPEKAWAILRLANAFDEIFEWRIFEGQTGTDIDGEMRELGNLELWPGDVDAAYHSLARGNWKRALQNAAQLPVSAISAVRKLSGFSIDELQVDTLEKIAKTDPTLAADVLQASNAACYHAHTRFSKIREAIGYIGVIRARQVLLASAARGLFGSARLRDLWKHSMAAAERMRDFAAAAGLDTEDAFTLGLLHDIGRSAFESVGDAAVTAARLRESGAPEMWVEIATMGRDHAECGAEILGEWGFPPFLVEAVRFHHCPEQVDSRFAYAMYLVEAESGENEDIGSPFRHSTASRHFTRDMAIAV